MSDIRVCSSQINWEAGQELEKKEDRQTFRKSIVDVVDVMRENIDFFSSILVISWCMVL